MDITAELFKLQDLKYKDFHSKLIPNISKDKIIGIRIPALRKLAKVIIKENMAEKFLCSLPHKYNDENLLHSILISEIEDYNSFIIHLEKFMPYIDNWSVCDIISPKSVNSHKAQLINKIKLWSSSKHTYTCRVGLKLLMQFYLDDYFKAEYLEIPAKIISDEYYVNMMIAWFMATALAKQWDSTIIYLENNTLPQWVHNKTIQKAIESYRITKEQKKYLRSLKINSKKE